MPLAKALELAQEYDLDLVEVAATARRQLLLISLGRRHWRTG